MRALYSILLAASLAACAPRGGEGETGGTSTVSWSGGGGQGGEGGGGGAGAEGGGPSTECIPAEGAGSETEIWNDGAYTATVAIEDRDSCARTYTLSTNSPLRDDEPANPRSFGEEEGWPVLRSGHDMLDALYALALEETRELSVDSIQDGAFNGGLPLPCPPGGCFETGRLWTYVWTRDTAYAAHLGLGVLEPTRMKNSLELKLSERRGGGERQIVQDTGSGGSYPVSTDRAIWALGAWQLLKVLGGTEREAFRDLAYEAIVNTAEHDRRVIYDGADGLYRGEQSFLDWREQSYPGWTTTDTAQIGMSKALSTNVAHHAMLSVAAELADEKGLTAERDRYDGWAIDLATAIRARLWLPGAGLYSTYVPTALDQAPAHRFDLLGSALVVSSYIADASEAASVVASYPHLPQGAPVIWPQQQLTPIYHNRAIWPFATALWLRAARRADVQNAAVISHGVRSLVRGAALNLSNMENFEAATGAAYVDDGAYSGPVVNSQRQLWSVAGFVSMVHDVLFGLEMTQSGIRFAPFVPTELRQTLLAGVDRIALSRFPFHGKRISVVLVLPQGATQALTAISVLLDGVEVGNDFIPPSALQDGSVFEITLAPITADTAMTALDAADIADYKNLYGPRTPVITSVSESGGLLQVAIDGQGEAAGDITFSVYRNGQQVAADLPGSTAVWTDTASTDQSTVSHCYSVEAVYASGTRSQHAKPVCWWGAGNARITTIDATAFTAVGGSLVNEFGYWHYQAWGDAGHTLTLPSFVPSVSGPHYLQLYAGNGAGSFTTGITCAVKLVEVFDGTTLVASGYVMMPHLGTWNAWRESSLLSVDLVTGTSYRIVVREDPSAVNMSEREHFATYGGTGGVGGRFNRVNIAQLKILTAEVQ